MFNFGSFILFSKNILLMLGIALIIYGASLLTKFIMSKTGATKIWEDYVGKYWSIFVFVISSIVYIIIAGCKGWDSYFVNGLMNGALLTGIQASMFKIVKIIIDLFSKIVNKNK